MKDNIVIFSSYIILSAVLFGFLGYNYERILTNNKNLLAFIFPEKFTLEELNGSFNQRPIRVLLVPGHDNKTWGTEFLGTKEADLNLLLSEKLYSFFKDDKRFDVVYTRNFSDGEYTKIFANYFEYEKDKILTFMREKKSVMTALLSNGAIENKTNDNHTKASESMLVKLYGINKWAEENTIDVTIHIHFNDYAGRVKNRAGKYSGFSIYVPESQFPNARASSAVAEAVYNEMQKYFAKSDLPIEKDGIIEDQELISVGSNASRDRVAFLIELGYIYEPVISSKNTRDTILNEMAYRIYRGIVGHFSKAELDLIKETSLSPFFFSDELKESSKPSIDVLHMQAILLGENLYPPQGKTLSDCPISGIFGKCVRESVNNFLKITATIDESTNLTLQDKLNILQGIK